MKRVLTPMTIAAIALLAGSLWAAAPAGLYTISTDTVQDNKTGLTWQRSVPSSTYTWADATSYCQALNLGGFSSGWRLPAKKELETLVDERVQNQAIDATAFPNAPAGPSWTSTPFAGASGHAWSVDFGYGNSYYDDTTSTSRVRCVR